MDFVNSFQISVGVTIELFQVLVWQPVRSSLGREVASCLRHDYRYILPTSDAAASTDVSEGISRGLEYGKVQG